MKRIIAWKRLFSAIIAALLCLGMVACAAPADSGSDTGFASGAQTDEAGADMSSVPEIPTDPATSVPGTLESETDTLPVIDPGENAVCVSSAELLDLIVSGEIAEDGEYAVSDGVGLLFSRDHNGQEFDLKNAMIVIAVRPGDAGLTVSSRQLTLKNARIAVYGGSAIRVIGENSAPVFSGIHISGDAESGFSVAGNGVTLSACTVCPDPEGSIGAAMILTGSNALAIDCNIEGTEIGVADRSQTGSTVQNCVFTDCRVAIRCETANTIVWYNTVNGGEVGILAEDEASQISASMSTVYNILAAKNRIDDAAQGIVFDRVSNCVALMNEAGSLRVYGCINTYVINNRISGTVTLSQTDYILANGNTCDSFAISDLSNPNGADLTDLTVRADVGVNEELLPHINKEQFAGMVGKTGFRSEYGTQDFSAFIERQLTAGKTEIILPPGEYNNGGISLSGLKNIRIYAYGTYDDIIKTGKNAITMSGCENVELYGMFIGSSVHPNYQGTVTAVTGRAGKETITFVSDPGYLADFTKSSNFPATNGGGGTIYKPGVGYPYSEVWFENGTKSYNAAEQTVTLTLISEGIKYGRLVNASTPANPLAVGSIGVGDRIAFRTYMGYCGISMDECTGVILEDVTVFNSAGFAFRDYDSNVAASMHRCAVTSGPAPVLDRIVSSELATVNEANKGVTWTDSYGRLRSAFYLNTSCDATHNTNSRTGQRVVSCLFEGMMDDGGNINAHYGTAVSYDSASRSFVYKRCNINSYQLLPQNFRAGDTLLLFTKSGEMVASVTATSATEQTVTGSALQEERYAVRLSEDIVLPDDTDSIIVQNASACGNGFLWDNVMVRNNNSYGVRIQARGGEIRNCSFTGLAKGGVSMIPQYISWPECGYAADVKVTENLFDELGIMGAQWYAWDSVESGSIYMPLCISAPGGNTSDPDQCLFENIEISGNVFRSRYSYYDISIAAAKNLSVTGNQFTGRLGMETSDRQKNIIIVGGNGIFIDGNAFRNDIDSSCFVKDNVAKNLTGSDVE